jgi:hypothetical protein
MYLSDKYFISIFPYQFIYLRVIKKASQVEKISLAKINEIKNMDLNSLSLAKISVETGISKCSVFHILKNLKIKLITPTSGPK